MKALLILALFFSMPAFAAGNNVSNNCPGNSCHGGQGGDGGNGTGVGVGVGVGIGLGLGHGGNGTGTGGNASVDIEGDSYDIPKLAPSAFAPSVSQGTICPIVSPSSKAGSVFFFSGSGTTGTTVNGICVAWLSKDTELVHQIACDEDSGYRRAVAKLGRTCE